MAIRTDRTIRNRQASVETAESWSNHCQTLSSFDHRSRFGVERLTRADAS